MKHGHIYHVNITPDVHSMLTCLTQGHTYNESIVKGVGITQTRKQHDVQRNRLNMSTHHIKGPKEKINLDPHPTIPNRISGKRHPTVEAKTGNTDRPTKY